ncbi:MAG: energy transducer TonB [Proteobacteria bacterium]|nr:energy transducer TonB [Pseudomonadota bacterium]
MTTPVGGAPAASVAAATTPATTAASTPAAGGEAAQRTDLTIADLLRNAGTAVGERRLIEPAGNSAVDFYLLVLGREPNNAAAQEGLREMFPLAAGEIEQKINAGQLDESRRAIDLLGKFDANNYTLTILRNKVDLKKKQMDREQEKRDQEKALATNAAKNNAAPAAAPSPAPAVVPAPAVAKTSPTTAEAAKATAAPKPTEPAVPAGGESRAAIPVSQSPPHYPPNAMRSQQEGWVEVSFVVAADGSVKDGKVENANPARIFNAAALAAISEWKFQPKLESGKPVEQSVRTRIVFKMPKQ